MTDDGPYRTPVLNRLRAWVRANADPDFDFLALAPGPVQPLARPLAAARVALVATADVHVRGDRPFESLERPLGDPSFRWIPHALDAAELALEAPYVDERYVRRDPEVALPRRALDALVDEGVLGSAAARHAGFAQGIVRPLPDLALPADEVARELRADGVDAAVVLPTCSLCGQSMAVLARLLEERGLATVLVSTLPELVERLAPPRALVLEGFPFGAPAGDPGNAPLHRAVLREALGLLEVPAHVCATSTLRWRAG